VAVSPTVFLYALAIAAALAILASVLPAGISAESDLRRYCGMNSSNGAIVTVDKLSKLFRSGGTTVPAVDDVSFSLPRGRMIAIKGASGSGKSTLLNLIGAWTSPHPEP